MTASSVPVLLVEDDAAIRLFTNMGLGKRGIAALAFADGPALLAWLDSGACQGAAALVADAGLPGIDGLAVAALARRRLPGLPVVVISGYELGADRLATLGPHVAPLSKPFSIDDLLAALDQARNGN